MQQDKPHLKLIVLIFLLGMQQICEVAHLIEEILFYSDEMVMDSEVNEAICISCDDLVALLVDLYISMALSEQIQI